MCDTMIDWWSRVAGPVRSGEKIAKYVDRRPSWVASHGQEDTSGLCLDKIGVVDAEARLSHTLLSMGEGMTRRCLALQM